MPSHLAAVTVGGLPRRALSETRSRASPPDGGPDAPRAGADDAGAPSVIETTGAADTRRQILSGPAPRTRSDPSARTTRQGR